MLKKIAIDVKNCIGCGLCSSIAPSVFEVKSVEGKLASVVKEEFDEVAEENNVLDAVDSCPTGVISIEEKLQPVPSP